MRLHNFGALDTNHHKWFKGPNDVWHSHTISGPKFSLVRIEGHNKHGRLGYCGYRLIFYWPSGAWWHVDWPMSWKVRP